MAIEILDLQPNAAGDVDTFQSFPVALQNWQAALPKSTDYVHDFSVGGSGTLTPKDAYHIDSQGVGTIASITVEAELVTLQFFTTRWYRVGLRINGVDYWAPQVTAPGTVTYTWDRNPASNQLWKWLEVDDMQIVHEGLADFAFGEPANIRVDAIKAQVEVVDMAVEFLYGPPRSGLGFDFFKFADEAIAEFLVSSHTNARLLTLQAYLLNQGIRWRVNRYDTPQEGPGRPYVYISSFIKEMPHYEPNTVTVQVETKLRIWAHQGNPDDAAKQCTDIATAIASMLAQTAHDANGTNWSSWYLNFSPPGQAPLSFVPSPVVIILKDGVPTGSAHANLSVGWHHQEVVQ